ncbi:hypothetical protein F7R23_34855 [Burkholderia diffusa]|nr:hypothetical protein F7R23_34855 [Burkholderia diffusa]
MKGSAGRRRRTASAGGRHGILLDWRRPECCHAARAAAIEKIAHCVGSAPFLYGHVAFLAAREAGRRCAG